MTVRCCLGTIATRPGDGETFRKRHDRIRGARHLRASFVALRTVDQASCCTIEHDIDNFSDSNTLDSFHLPRRVMMLGT